MQKCNVVKAKLKFVDSFPTNYIHPIFKITEDSVEYTYTIEHSNLYLIIDITSNVEIPYKLLWDKSVDLLKLYNFLRGYFPTFEMLNFYIKDDDSGTIHLPGKCLNNMTSHYSTESFYNTFDFRISLNNLEDVFRRWLELNKKLSFANNVYFSATSNSPMPKDLSFSLIIQLFEEINIYLKNRQNTSDDKTDEDKRALKNHIKNLIDRDQTWNEELFTKAEVKDFICRTILTYFKTNKTLRECLNQAISNYGEDIFQIEYSSVEPNKFLTKLVESRNKIFHIDGSKQNTLKNAEYTAYCMKFSLLYRRVIIKQLLHDFNFNTDIQKYYITLIDKWICRECGEND
ncbi:HEPN domain-containing protein [Legionella longbeachae]|uniref:HEPN domain-containing protein n=1 Tax=Legionella longbeachae TaxID=450 RepID=UPI0001BEC240|nr:HEPN domain-containing protein [Legionella longbeachae]EEZ96785.1 conserved hypothetical protein [Legionella longbeachae D-4968]QIN33900.1 hypothetical protein GCB94_17985 [Legionella longbeachae]